jgi:hypothetical protein
LATKSLASFFKQQTAEDSQNNIAIRKKPHFDITLLATGTILLFCVLRAVVEFLMHKS